MVYRCPHCNHSLSIPDHLAGQAGTCNHCGEAITVPKLIHQRIDTPQPSAVANNSKRITPRDVACVIIGVVMGFVFAAIGASGSRQVTATTAPVPARAIVAPAIEPVAPIVVEAAPVYVVQQEVANDPAYETVYVTNSGQKYHRGTCRHVTRSKYPLSVASAKYQGYSPCSVCKP